MKREARKPRAREARARACFEARVVALTKPTKSNFEESKGFLFFAWKKNSKFFNMEKNYFLLKIIFYFIFIALKVLRM